MLGGLRRTLRAMRGEWELVFAAAGAEALQRCAAQAFDVVVSDAQMPGMAGPDLLKEVMRRQPDSARFVLSGQFRWDLAIRSVGVAHQFWNKPCDPWDLISAARRSVRPPKTLSGPGCAERGFLRRGAAQPAHRLRGTRQPGEIGTRLRSKRRPKSSPATWRSRPRPYTWPVPASSAVRNTCHRQPPPSISWGSRPSRPSCSPRTHFRATVRRTICKPRNPAAERPQLYRRRRGKTHRRNRKRRPGR